MLRAALLVCCLAAGLMHGAYSHAQSRPAPPTAPTRPAWTELTAEQREALAPLAGQWAGMPAERKRKWLDIASKYPRLSPEGKERLHTRMAEFAKLSPQQKETARENFRRAYELPAEQRNSLVQQYQDLPPEKKKELADRDRQKSSKPAARKEPAAKSAK